jgi:selenocysteine lyase/cysteine desulfurase
MDWSAWRDEFPIFRSKRYLNTCSLGPLSLRVRAAQERFLDEWDERGAAAWYDRWLDAIDGLRSRFARLIGAQKEEVGIAPSVSVALSSIASALDHRGRPRVVLSEMDFPTVSYQWAVRPGTERILVASRDGMTVDPAAYESAVDGRTAAVVASHVLYTSGAIQDLGRIARIARRHGALSIIDAYQATGQLPTDVHSADVDVLLTGGLKWLLGGTGIALIYVRRNVLQRLAPTITGWFGNEHQFEFDPRRFEFRSDARRFELGTPANAAVYACSAGIDIVTEIGVDAIRKRTTELVTDYAERVTDAGFELRTPSTAEARAGIVMVKFDDPAKAVKALASEGIVADYRHDRLRVSPYFYNTPEDNAAVIEVLRSLRP